MGALHEGHLSLMRAALAQGDYVVVTIFVNPTQFAAHEDLGKYPRPMERDTALCAELGIPVIFFPSETEIYPPGFQTTVSLSKVTRLWEGACRPGHFDGVATVVLKLFQIVQPDTAYFGAKDYQQQLLIRQMCRDLNLQVDIRTCPTVREPDGLALSSRNTYLTSEERASALSLSRALQLAADRISAGVSDLAAVRDELHSLLSSTPLVQVEYATIVDPETLEELNRPRPEMQAIIAARVGSTRLIDNARLTTAGGTRLDS